ncbi:antibiotic biosynthesis monooxygenase family protein [Micromonospora sp. CA-259024]|uniref:antibiotic biosynthesis monooxygenase family protein n=1 Tax=Micromonospora sp. CA-259024 TaxID=3239965 RepID=UPI003D8C3D56
MLRTVLEMTVRPGAEDAFRAAWLETARRAARLPGSVAQTLLRDPDRPADHVIMADWSGPDALDAFQRSPERAELSARLEQFRDGARKRVLETVEHVPAQPPVER